MAKYKLDEVAFRKNLLNAPWMVALMERRAQEGYELARSIAPDAPPYGEGYVASFSVESGTEGGIHHDRAYGRLSNHSDHARYVEFGTEHNDAHHVLGKAMDVMGQ